MPFIDGVIVTKIYDFIILPIIHTTLLLRSNKLWKRKNQIYVTTLYLMNFLYNQKLGRNWYLNNSKIILEVKDLGQLWRIFKHLACYYFSTQFGVENRRAIILRNVRVESRRAMNTKTRNTQISCFNAFGSWNLYAEISCFNAFGSWHLSVSVFSWRPNGHPSQNLLNEKMEKLLIICK